MAQVEAERSPEGGNHAVVVGGGLTGLLAARVLADHFERVTIVDRDHFPDRPVFRSGVPQSRHIHTLLMRGREILEQLFPGLDADLAAAGAVTIEWPADVLWFGEAGWGGRFRSGLASIGCSRELLEWAIRQRVLALGQVHAMEGWEMIGLVAAEGGQAVGGVSLRPRPAAHPAGPDLDLRADLVVDASGRESQAPQWLAQLGYPAPEEWTVDPALGYATRCYARPPASRTDWKALGILMRPPTLLRSGVMQAIEGGQWIVTLAGAGGDYPPTDEAEYVAFARSLANPLLYEVILTAQPVSPIVGYRRTENCLRRYERLDRRPERFVVMGDAVCALNPIYGQGMTVSAQSALVLDTALREQRTGRAADDLTGLARRFQQALARSNTTPWLMATGEDARYATGQGRPALATRLAGWLAGWYLNRVVVVATGDPVVQRRFIEVLHLLRPPAALFAPDVLRRVVRGGRGASEVATPPSGPSSRAAEDRVREGAIHG